MLNNFIGGGQVFLHKVRMFRQVLRATLFVSAIAGMLMAWSLHNAKNSNLDLDGAYTYFKAQVSIRVHPALSAIAIKPSPPNVDAYSNGRLVKRNMLSSSVVSCQRYISAWHTFVNCNYLLTPYCNELLTPLNTKKTDKTYNYLSININHINIKN